ncbi:MAG: IS982 family transposase [Pseudomonadota bacterium]
MIGIPKCVTKKQEIPIMCRYTTIFTIVDDFCKLFEGFQYHYCLEDGNRRNRITLLSLSEMISIVIFFHFSGYKYFKQYYEYEICDRLAHLFPNRPCYDRFIQLIPRLFVPTALMLHLVQGKKTGEYYVDSTHFAVCKNKRISRHKTFSGLAERGKSTMGWFFGFKLHLVCNFEGEIVGVRITPGNEDDRKAFEALVNSHALKGKAYGDKGYIGKDLFKRLWCNGLHLVTGIKKNMKNYLMPWLDKLLLRKRVLIETIFSVLKEEFNIRPNKHRSPVNFFVSLFAPLIAYQIKSNKPKLNFKHCRIAYP